MRRNGVWGGSLTSRSGARSIDASFLLQCPHLGKARVSIDGRCCRHADSGGTTAKGKADRRCGRDVATSAASLRRRPNIGTRNGCATTATEGLGEWRFVGIKTRCEFHRPIATAIAAIVRTKGKSHPGHGVRSEIGRASPARGRDGRNLPRRTKFNRAVSA